MLEIPWQKISSILETYEVNGYTLKRRNLKKGIMFEVWVDGKLLHSTDNYSDFLKYAKDIIQKGKN